MGLQSTSTPTTATTNNTPYSWGSAALAQRSQSLLHTSLCPPDPAPRQELLTPASPDPDLSEWPPCSTPPPSTPHSALLLSGPRRPGCTGPSSLSCESGRPRVSPTIRPHRKTAARLSAPLAGSRASRLNRCPCHKEPAPGARAEAATGTPQPRSPERLGGSPAPPPCPAALVFPLALTSRG